MVSACQWSLCLSMPIFYVLVEVLVFQGQCLLVVFMSFCADMLYYSGLLVFQGWCWLVVLVSFCASMLCYSGDAGSYMVDACQLLWSPSVPVSCVIVEVLVFHGQCLLVFVVSFSGQTKVTALLAPAADLPQRLLVIYYLIILKHFLRHFCCSVTFQRHQTYTILHRYVSLYLQ